MNNIFKKIAQMESNAEQIQLASWQEKILLMTENENLFNLSTHELNLSLTSDLKKYISASKNYEKLFNQLNKQVEKLIKDKEDVLNKKSDLYILISKSNTSANQFIYELEKKIREIGLNPTENPIYKEAKDVYNNNSIYIDKLDKISKI